MSRLARWMATASLIASVAGCCAGPCRFYENAYGWNNPDIEQYAPGPPPPVTTPPGFTTPAYVPPPREDATPNMPGDPTYREETLPQQTPGDTNPPTEPSPDNTNPAQKIPGNGNPPATQSPGQY